MKEALNFLEDLLSDDEHPAAIYIESPQNEVNANEEDDGAEEAPDFVCSEQLKAGCEVGFSRIRRIKTMTKTYIFLTMIIKAYGRIKIVFKQ